MNHFNGNWANIFFFGVGMRLIHTNWFRHRKERGRKSFLKACSHPTFAFALQEHTKLPSISLKRRRYEWMDDFCVNCGWRWCQLSGQLSSLLTFWFCSYSASEPTLNSPTWLESSSSMFFPRLSLNAWQKSSNSLKSGMAFSSSLLNTYNKPNIVQKLLLLVTWHTCIYLFQV